MKNLIAVGILTVLASSAAYSHRFCPRILLVQSGIRQKSMLASGRLWRFGAFVVRERWEQLALHPDYRHQRIFVASWDCDAGSMHLRDASLGSRGQVLLH